MGTFLIFVCTTGCSSSGIREDGTIPQSQKYIPKQDYDDDSKARGGAYVTDGMSIRRNMPSHSDWRPIEFYYKHCTLTGNQKAHFSKTEYECSKPY